jgi:hypothetical protein
MYGYIGPIPESREVEQPGHPLIAVALGWQAPEAALLMNSRRGRRDITNNLRPFGVD